MDQDEEQKKQMHVPRNARMFLENQGEKPMEEPPEAVVEEADDKTRPLDLFRDADQITDGSIMELINMKTGEVIASAVIRKPKKRDAE